MSVFPIPNNHRKKSFPLSYSYITYDDLFAEIRKNIKEQKENTKKLELFSCIESKVKILEDKDRINKVYTKILVKDDNASKINKLICNLEYYFGDNLNKILEEISTPVVKKIEDNISTDDIFNGTKWKIKRGKKEKNEKKGKILCGNNDTKVSLYRSKRIELSCDNSYIIKVYIYLSYDGCYFEVLISKKKGSLDTKVKEKLCTSLRSIEKIKWIKRDKCDFSFTSAPFCKLEEADGKCEEIANKFCEIVETICKQDF